MAEKKGKNENEAIEQWTEAASAFEIKYANKDAKLAPSFCN